MTSNEELLDKLTDKVTAKVIGDVTQSINKTIEQEIKKNLSGMLMEGEFHKYVNKEFQDGLRDIFQEISSVNRGDNEQSVTMEKKEAEQLFSETSDQLDQIVETTEKATVEIMEVIEKHLDLQEQAHGLLQRFQEATPEKDDIAKLLEMNTLLNQDLMQIMTTLSFQDITGQRIKRIVGALKKVEKTVFELYLSTGLKIKAREEEPEKDIEQLEKEATQKVSELKGPTKGVSQSDVDDLLSELGFG
jgi:chemotaxis protein CheZ